MIIRTVLLLTQSSGTRGSGANPNTWGLGSKISDHLCPGGGGGAGGVGGGEEQLKNFAKTLRELNGLFCVLKIVCIIFIL